MFGNIDTLSIYNILMGYSYDPNEKYYPKISIISKELKTVYFDIDLPNTQVTPLFDEKKLLKIIDKETSLFFERNCIKSKILEKSGKGAGPLISIAEIINQFISLIKVVGIISSLKQAVSSVILFFQTKNNSYQKRSLLNIYLRLESKTEVDGGVIPLLDKIYPDYLVNLLQVGNSLCEQIENNYPTFYCNLSIAILIRKNNYIVNFDLPHKDRDHNRISKYIQIINKLAIKENIRVSYEFTNKYVIQRTDTNDPQNSKNAYKRTKYFLIFSNKLIKDYLNV